MHQPVGGLRLFSSGERGATSGQSGESARWRRGFPPCAASPICRSISPACRRWSWRRSWQCHRGFALVEKLQARRGQMHEHDHRFVTVWRIARFNSPSSPCRSRSSRNGLAPTLAEKFSSVTIRRTRSRLLSLRSISASASSSILSRYSRFFGRSLGETGRIGEGDLDHIGQAVMLEGVHLVIEAVLLRLQRR